jgi:hypothetical protein
MQKNILTLTIGVAVLTSACTDRYASSRNKLDVNEPEYGSADTYKNSIEMAGRVYPLHQITTHKIAANDYVPAQQYASYSPAQEYTAPYQPLGYFGDNVAQNATNPVTTSSTAVSAATQPIYQDSYIWY